MCAGLKMSDDSNFRIQIQDARGFCQIFFSWYNTELNHGGIGLLTRKCSTTGGRKKSSGPGKKS
jgi:hypothetical protein